MAKTLQVLPRRETIELLLDRSQRPKAALPIRTSFVQQGPRAKPTPGPLAAFVFHRREKALELFLLVHAVASGGDFSVTEWASTWARCIGLFDMTSGPTTVSRQWRWLVEQRLIRRERGTARRTKITVLREDGRGKRYTHPYGKKVVDPYLQLPFTYWLGETDWSTKLSLPGKAMLLIALSRPQRFELPQSRVPDWYGISEDTATRGLMELREVGALSVVETVLQPSLSSPTGLVRANVYSLNPPFGQVARGKGLPSSKRKGKRSA